MTTCNAKAPDNIKATCTLEAGHAGNHYAETADCYVSWDPSLVQRAAYEPPAIESTSELLAEVMFCRECESPVGFCHPACSSQGRD